MDLIGIIRFLWDFDENYPRFFKWVILPLALLVVIADVVSCVDGLVSGDAVETVDCSAPAVRCINTDGDLP